MNDNFIISLHKDKQSVCIIFHNSYTTLDCNTIYNLILESLQDDEIYKDISLQDLYSYEIYVFLDSMFIEFAGLESLLLVLGLVLLDSVLLKLLDSMTA